MSWHYHCNSPDVGPCHSLLNKVSYINSCWDVIVQVNLAHEVWRAAETYHSCDTIDGEGWDHELSRRETSSAEDIQYLNYKRCWVFMPKNEPWLWLTVGRVITTRQYPKRRACREQTRTSVDGALYSYTVEHLRSSLMQPYTIICALSCLRPAAAGKIQM